MKKRTKYFLYKNFFEPRAKGRILLVDNEFFVVHNMEIDYTFLSSKSLNRLVELRIEAICPFKPEDILYGYVWRKKDRSLTIFIAHKAHVAEFYGKILHFSYILPHFFCNLMYNFLPRIEKAEIVDDYIIFSSGERNFRLRTTDLAIYRANLVPYKKKIRRLRWSLLGKIFERGIYVCFFWLFILFCCYGVLEKKNYQLAQLDKKINCNSIDEIEYKLLIVNKLRKLLENGNFCLYALNEVNNVRPSGVAFSDVRAQPSRRTLSINGHASAVGKVANYQRALNEISEIKKASISHVHAKDGESFFDLEVQFE